MVDKRTYVLKLDQDNTSDIMLGWLKHRLGSERYDGVQDVIICEGLNLNRGSKEYLDTFGNSEFKAFIGFIDLIGYSRSVCGLDPAAAFQYASTFLNPTIKFMCDEGFLIDKTIGDELMFVLPDRTDDWDTVPPAFVMGRLVGFLHDRYYDLQKRYPFKIGLSYGKVAIGAVGCDDFMELTVYGECVNLAKRTHGLSFIKNNPLELPMLGALATLKREDIAPESFEHILSIVAGNASRFDHEIIHQPEPLKGIGNYKCAVIYPKGSR